MNKMSHLSQSCSQVYWHSSAHVLGEAMERFYGGCLCYGPPIENGFYYDMFLGDQKWASLFRAESDSHNCWYNHFQDRFYFSFGENKTDLRMLLLFLDMKVVVFFFYKKKVFLKNPINKKAILLCKVWMKCWYELLGCTLFLSEPFPALSLATWRFCVRLWWRRSSHSKGLSSAKRLSLKCLKWVHEDICWLSGMYGFFGR